MLLSYNWLKELTGASLPARELAAALTRVGLNVEEVSPAAGGDWTLAADVTTNRPDWLCHLGVAHEIAAALGGRVTPPPAAPAETGPAVDGLTGVTLLPGAADHCPRYTLRVIRGVRVGSSPDWVRDRLAAIGQRSINNVVDVTNLVCFEMNQPLHAFDLDRLAGGRIVLRLAREGEEFDAITGEHCVLGGDTLVIADAEKAVAVAGVKGGRNTEVGVGTANVLLESAWFQPGSVRRAARRTRLASESSYRYERGIDPGMTERASRRAAALILELAGGSLAAGVVDTNPGLGAPWEVTLRHDRCDALLGVRVPPEETRRIFAGLGLREIRADGNSITVEPPSFRQDLRREVDLIEEVIRLAGYDRIPERISMPLALAREMPETACARTVRRVLAGLGYHECVSDSFVPVDWCLAFAPGAERLIIQNPVNAERPAMRTALIPSVLEARRTNRLAPDARLFEIGRVYRRGPAGRPVENTRLAVVDDRGPEFVRGALEAAARALALAGRPGVRPEPEIPGLARDGAAGLTLDGAAYAVVGPVAAEQTERFDLPLRPAAGEADMDFLAGAPRLGRNYRPLPRFPGVRRDVSLALAEGVRWADVEEVAQKAAGWLDSLAFESLYRGKGLKPGDKGLAFSMLLRAPDRSLTDAEANAVRDAVVAALLAAFPGSEIR